MSKVNIRCEQEHTFRVSKRSGFYPCPAADTAGSRIVSQAGGLLLTETVRAVGLNPGDARLDLASPQPG